MKTIAPLMVGFRCDAMRPAPWESWAIAELYLG
jgi:hypothetical protein